MLFRSRHGDGDWDYEGSYADIEIDARTESWPESGPIDIAILPWTKSRPQKHTKAKHSCLFRSVVEVNEFADISAHVAWWVLSWQHASQESTGLKVEEVLGQVDKLVHEMFKAAWDLADRAEYVGGYEDGFRRGKHKRSFDSKAFVDKRGEHLKALEQARSKLGAADI